MTTTVIVKTHDWPVAVVTNSNNEYKSPTVRTYGYSGRTEFQAAHTEKSYSVTNTTSVEVRELPKGAVDLFAMDTFGGIATPADPVSE